MAEPIGVASGLLTLVVFSLNASKSLYSTVASYNSHQRSVRELREELQSLELVLESLHATATAEGVDLSALNLPLFRCGRACKDFKRMIDRCSEHSGGMRTSVRDWVRLTYMGNDINGFKNLLSTYKSTITIALCDANLRTSVVATNVLEEYQESIQNTMSDLQERLSKVDDTLQAILPKQSPGGNEGQMQDLQEERDSIQRCIDICTKVSSHIDEVRPTVFQNISTVAGDHHSSVSIGTRSTPAEQDTDRVLGRCRDDLSRTLSRLTALNDPDAQREELSEEIDGIKRSLAICREAFERARADRTNIMQDVSMAEDGYQLMVSTIGDLIFARNISAGARATLWFGQMSDESLQQLSRDRCRTEPGQARRTKCEPGKKFEDLYGKPRNL